MYHANNVIIIIIIVITVRRFLGGELVVYIDVLSKILVTLLLITLIGMAQCTTFVQAKTKSEAYTVHPPFIAIFSNGDSLVVQDITVEQNASNIRVLLIGKAIDLLNVVNYDGRPIGYKLGNQTGELVINTDGKSNIRLTYETPDLVNKAGRLWMFSYNSPTAFSLKMPANSTITDFGRQQPNSVRRIGDQELLGFSPGSIRVGYVIGFLGTEYQANAAIESATVSISDAKEKLPGIILRQSEHFLQMAQSSKMNKDFLSAERFGVQASDVTQSGITQYTNALNTIRSAESEIKKARESGYYTDSSNILLSNAKNQFSRGEYLNASNSASASVLNVVKLSGNSKGISIGTALVIVVPAAAAAIASIFVYSKRRHKIKGSLSEARDDPVSYSKEQVSSIPIMKNQERPFLLKDNQHQISPKPPSPSLERPFDQKPSKERAAPQETVAKILEDRPYLKSEDQQVLRFLGENEGAAFESEVRAKFDLPKTTIWRLVKRLEREELIEVRKAGGQNLIKLRFGNDDDRYSG
jgi:uncharacterized membrane protein